jgi:hypothetical protein
MAQQTIGLGTTPNDGTGDTVRVAGDKINDNFDELYLATAYANNATTSALSDATLDATYPTAVVGFRVFAVDIIAGALIYFKTTTGWYSTPITLVV